MSNSALWKLRALADEPEPPTRVVNMNRLGEALLSSDGTPVDVLFVYNCNPLATAPNQERVRAGLAREDLFTIVFDQVMTDTARYADLLLPATTFLEHSELSRGYGAMVLQEVKPALAAVGEARPNYEVFGDLCRRMGLARSGEPESPAALTQTLLAGTGRGAALRAALDDGGVAFPDCGAAPVQFVDELPRTADRKIHLCPPELDREAPGGLYAYRPDPATRRFPLALISPATASRISSTFGQLHRKRAALDLHPADAASRGIEDGDRVRVFNEFGEVICRARLTDDVRPGVASLPKGLWSHNTENGSTANALAPDTLSDLGGGACYNDARVEVERAAGGAS
jgi:anaerobic selenocysteine-containing dehydrogenase